MTASNGNGSAAATANGGVYDAAYARRVMWILAGLVTLVLYVEGMLTPSLPTIAREFHIGSSQASLILSSYIITGVALSPVVGKLGDIYGKKRMLGIVILIYAACVSVTGFSPTFTFMVIARAFQGIGLTIFPLGMSLVREQFPRALVPRAQGFLSAMFGAGFAISLPLGAWVSNNYGWRVTYHSAIPFVVLLAILVFVVLRESKYRRPEARVDYVGASMLGLSLALIVLALSEGPTWGWSTSGTLSLFAIGAVLLVPLVLYELRYRRSGG
jgi:MFS family permease